MEKRITRSSVKKDVKFPISTITPNISPKLSNADIRRLRVNEIKKTNHQTINKSVIDNIKNKYPLIDKLYVQNKIKDKSKTSINLDDYEEYDEKELKQKEKSYKTDKNLKKFIEDDDSDSDSDDSSISESDFKKEKRLHFDDSDDSDDSDDDSDDLDIPKHIAKKLKMDKDELDNFSKKLGDLKDESNNNRVNIYDVIKEGFNKSDSIWFYENLKRINELEGKERFDLEDKIKKKYNFIKTLKDNGLYQELYKSTDRDVIKEIINSQHNKYVKTILINRMQNASEESSEEYLKALNWMDVILSIPNSVKRSTDPITIILNNLHQKLSSSLYGMDSIINQILQAVCTILTDSKNKGYILTLVGPPGVGKTSICSMIAEVIGMGYKQISCGSIKDQAVIMGHSSTYIGAKPGIITQTMIKTKQLDNVIVLDELDKLVDNTMVPIFLHVLDKVQNDKFHDAFCPEIDIDLSSNMWMITVNEIDKLDPVLKDRLKIITIAGYSLDQKVEIVYRHTIPRIMEKTGIHIPIDKTTIKKYVQSINVEGLSGVREIERFFEDIYEKLLLIKNVSHIKAQFGFPQSFNVDKLTSIDAKIINSLSQ